MTQERIDFNGSYKKATVAYLPVYLKDSSGNEKTGLDGSDVDMFLLKHGASSEVEKNLLLSGYLYSIYNKSSRGYNKSTNPYFRFSAGNALIEVDATNMPGAYLVEVNTSDTNTNGILVFAIKGAAIRNYYGSAQIVEALPGDIADHVEDHDADWDGRAL